MVKNVLNTLRKKQKNNKGFSLVELIVVIAIMAVLIGVLAPQFIKYVERSRQSTDLQNVEELKNAVEVEAADEGIKGNATITIEPGASGNPGKATVKIVTGKVTKPGTNTETETSKGPDSLGKSEVNLKSSGWEKQVYTYSAENLEWELIDGKGKTANKNNPKRDMADVFSLNGN